MKIGVSLPIRELENDLDSIKQFAVMAEELGFNHLRIPDQVIRPNNKHLHEPLTLLSYLAGFTSRIELVPSVIILPLRKTVEFARQSTGLDILSGGRLRLGIGVGSSEEEYRFSSANFQQRGVICDEQMSLLNQLWRHDKVNFKGKWHEISDVGINPLPIQRPIPMWIGAQSSPAPSVIRRIAQRSNGWFVLADPKNFGSLKASISSEAEKVNRNPEEIGTEAGVAVVGPREREWQERVEGWRSRNLTHLCMRTLGGGLKSVQHLEKLSEVAKRLSKFEDFPST